MIFIVFKINSAVRIQFKVLKMVLFKVLDFKELQPVNMTIYKNKKIIKMRL